MTPTINHDIAIKTQQNHPSATLNAWLQQDSMQGALERVMESVRSNPNDIRERWLLFQMLCLMGDWDRALKQLQTCVQIDPEREQTAQVIRGLIRSEAQRAEVFAGKSTPGYIMDQPPEWIALLLEALHGASENRLDQADAARELALSQAVDSPGDVDGMPFGWISDSDTRLGPVCELIVAGMYRWCPFSDLSSLRLHAPSGLLDLLWVRADCTLHDGSVLKAYIPARYPGSEHGEDAIRLSRETVWQDEGKTGIIALGQKTWMTDGGDLSLLDLRELTFQIVASA
ncbi:hypothetical protein AGMMS49545_19370 [Betaproteobacteria bacterium]|nr:hypothetical protein AGMMS49545_19370 [Betaproteobacteria bacterium]GHU47867.1 hypothetical protein AGMMS50289_23690 [Betaproteobacteria bacterium]